jgi:hypothetical protein
MAFRSGLEEKVADLLTNLGVKYEYESTKVPYVLQCNYTPDFLLPNQHPPRYDNVVCRSLLQSTVQLWAWNV